MRNNFKGHYQNPKTNLKKGQKKEEKIKYRPITGSVLFSFPNEPIVYQFSERVNAFPEFHNYMETAGYKHKLTSSWWVGTELESFFKSISIYRVEEKDIQQVMDDLKMIGITIKVGRVN